MTRDGDFKKTVRAEAAARGDSYARTRTEMLEQRDSATVVDKATLTRALVEPEDALVRQYQAMFALDNIELEFTDEALDAIAEEALRRDAGTRGLRAILEDILLKTMYELPARTDVARCVVDRRVVVARVDPTLVPRADEGDSPPRRPAS